MGISDRIVSERKRLGLSQAKFAQCAGVSLSTQKRYEKGERAPDTAYLEALAKEGVDVNYVMFNISGDEIVDCPYAANMLVPPGSVVKPVTRTECRDMAAGVTLRSSGGGDGIKQWFDYCQSCALNPGKIVGRNPDYLSDSDIALLSAVLEGVDCSLANQCLSMPYGKKARTVAMLYRVFKVSGTVDPAMIEDAVKLAMG